MECKLCRRNRLLCDSHIIPEFFYKPGYDENGQMLVFKKGELKAKNVQHQQYVYEKLLCSECDGKILNQRYEKYFYKLWYLDKTLPRATTSDFLDVTGFDYASFKLFHLSILWRASVSSLEPYKTVVLDGKHEERIREMLLNGDPGQPDEYQIFGALLQFPGANDALDGFIISPVLLDYESLPIYMFVFGGCAWHYVIGNRAIQTLLPFSLSTNGSIKLRVRALQNVTPVSRFMIEDVSHMSMPKSKI